MSREEISVFISPSKQQRPLYPPRFLHPVHRRSTPTRRPLFYAADRWTLVLDAPEDKQIDQSARPKSQKWISIPVALPSLTSPLLWVLSEATSQVNTHGSATKEKKKEAQHSKHLQMLPPGVLKEDCSILCPSAVMSRLDWASRPAEPALCCSSCQSWN